MFNDYINNPKKLIPTLFRIDGYNIENITLFINNCMEDENINSNVHLATFNLSLWLNDFLNKYHKKISFITICPNFLFNGERITCDSKELNEEELDDFFDYYTHRKLVVCYVTKRINLQTLNITYMVRYADITKKEDEREYKLVEILEREQQ
jgi:hypothetical protein